MTQDLQKRQSRDQSLAIKKTSTTRGGGTSAFAEPYKIFLGDIPEFRVSISQATSRPIRKDLWSQNKFKKKLFFFFNSVEEVLGFNLVSL